jgi:osomolarity two-component system sensor histidine kinase SLN1
MRRHSSAAKSFDADIERRPFSPRVLHPLSDTDNDEEDFGDSPGPSLPLPSALRNRDGSRGRGKSARIANVWGGHHGDSENKGLRVHWAKFKKRMGTGTAPSTSEMEESAYTGGSSILIRRPSGTFGDSEKMSVGVDEVVVDRAWFDDIKSSVMSQSEGGEMGTGEKGSASAGFNGGTNATDHDSLAINAEGFWARSFILVILRYRMWPAIFDFFTLSFDDPASENGYAKETWFMQKTLALWSSFFLIMNWVSA